MSWVRARRPEQIEERRSEILDAAAQLFSEMEYREVSLNEIARRADFTKSNIYRYFSSLDEIFLVMYARELDDWKQKALPVIAALPVGTDSHTIVSTFIDLAAGNERLMELTSLLAASLERNSSYEAVRDFKRELRAIMGEFIVEFQRILPGTSEDDLAFFFNVAQAHSAGLWPRTKHNKVLACILSWPSMANLKMEFKPQMTRLLTMVLDGIRK